MYSISKHAHDLSVTTHVGVAVVVRAIRIGVVIRVGIGSAGSVVTRAVMISLDDMSARRRLLRAVQALWNLT